LRTPLAQAQEAFNAATLDRYTLADVAAGNGGIAETWRSNHRV
jgi:hypothetical protein